MAVIDGGSSTAGKANVDASYNLQVVTPGRTAAGVAVGGGEDNAGAVAFFSENDPGEVSGARLVRSPETDNDFRLRIAHDNFLDRETFNYTAQNTGKHSHTFTTLTATVSSSGLLLNSANITTTTTGMTFGTHAEFPVGLGATTTYCETSMAVSAASVPSNVVVDIGMFRRGATTAFAPTDGAYFRASSSGWFGVLNRGGVETQVALTGFTPVANQNYLFTVALSEKKARFWIDDVNYGAIENTGAGQPFISASLPWSTRFAIVGGAAGAGYQATITDYTISSGGSQFAASLDHVGNRTLGSYQGLSGGTMGSLANYANSANPTAAVPTNTTAALGTGLGGQFWETASLAVNTDGIICSYQNPAGTTAVQGRRLVIRGVSLASYIQTVIVGGPFVAQWSLAFGHTAVSLATAETASFATATTKAARRIPLPAFTQVVTAAQAVSTLVSQPGGAQITFDAPIYVNPGEFVALVTKHVGTVGTSGTIAHVVAFDYGWE